jgi:hypothetical protein
MKRELTDSSTKQLANGIYYVVLADLVGSTNYMKKMGNDAGIARLNAFVGAAKQALTQSKPKNSGEFIKDNGDAVLFVFRHFPDIVQWRLEFDGSLCLAWQHDDRLATRLAHGHQGGAWICFQRGSTKIPPRRGLACARWFDFNAKAQRHEDASPVAQTSKSAVSRIFKSAAATTAHAPPTWKSATQPVWKPALRSRLCALAALRYNFSAAQHPLTRPRR